ncbi:hypothetical protein BD311DRAFT_553365 [Dichomitus squalens]|uniref:Uncharacterized protein n=1 Tax=Dichomitus squalens TaxID=114155 RepID=A0A4Q9MBL6_9APHY|nr:hypothetical protein BD311DRAFT_553365 [Dichomitus squalens]
MTVVRARMLNSLRRLHARHGRELGVFDRRRVDVEGTHKVNSLWKSRPAGQKPLKVAGDRLLRPLFLWSDESRHRMAYRCMRITLGVKRATLKQSQSCRHLSPPTMHEGILKPQSSTVRSLICCVFRNNVADTSLPCRGMQFIWRSPVPCQRNVMQN